MLYKLRLIAGKIAATGVRFRNSIAHTGHAFLRNPWRAITPPTVVHMVIVFSCWSVGGSSQNLAMACILGIASTLSCLACYLVSGVTKKPSIGPSALGLVFNAALNIMAFAGLYYSYGYLGPEAECSGEIGAHKGFCEPGSSWSTALYFSIVTWATLGYGDYQPRPDMRLLSGFEALFSYFYIGLAIAVLTARRTDGNNGT